MSVTSAALGTLLAASLVFFTLSLHSVQEGHVGVYWRGGALLSEITEPGFHLKVPFVTSFAEVQVTVQTDAVTSIPCGTSGGVMLTFGRVEVVNRLRKALVYPTLRNYTINYDKTWIFDKLHHELNQFCSKSTLQDVYIEQFDRLDEQLALALQRDCDKWAPGIEIIAVRVTKPRIPDAIQRNYEQMEVEKTKLLIATEAQAVVQIEAETERKRAAVEAQKIAEVSAINMAKELKEKEVQQRIAAIEDSMHIARERALADAQHYSRLKQADANAALLTDAYLETQRISSLKSNTKIYFGESIPSLFVERSRAAAGSTLPLQTHAHQQHAQAQAGAQAQQGSCQDGSCRLG